jgi:hypothetical protein
MALRTDRWAGRVRTLGLDVLGLLVLMTLPAMWVSWTEAMLVGVTGIGLIAAALYCLLLRFERPRGRGQRAAAASGTVSAVNDRVLAELSNLGPMVYHNRLTAERGLQNTLDKVKQAFQDER